MQQETSDFKQKFSEGLKYARLRIGKTQAEIAKELGEVPSAIANWEAGTNGPHRGKLAKIATLFGVSIDPITGDWGRAVSPPPAHDRTAAPVLQERSSRPDMSWMLADYGEETLIEKAVRALQDKDLEAVERVHRARVFLDEIERRVNSETVVMVAGKTLLKAAVEAVKKEYPESGPKPRAASTSGKGDERDVGVGKGSKSQR